MPQLIVPVDKSQPTSVIGKQFIGRLDPVHSTLFNFNVPADYAGKACRLTFFVPSPSSEWWQPIQMKTAGGIAVSELDQLATETTSFSTVGTSRPVGSVGLLAKGEGNLVASFPCPAGKMVGYQVDSIGGLDLQFFEMITPALGLFMTPV
jgi:glucan endo-1,3-beta-D-glucosidase